MGAGGIERESKIIFHSLLFSLTKIDPLRKFFYSNNFKGKLCQALSDIVKNNSFDQLNEYVNMTRIKFKEKNDDIDSEILIKYSFDKIINELKDENKEKESILINNLFYCNYDFISEEGKKEKKYLENPLIISIDLSSLDLDVFKEKEKGQINLNKILQKLFDENSPKKNQEYINKENRMPEICIITLSNINDNTICYYISQEIRCLPYELISFIEDKSDDGIKNNFFKENSFWYQYQTKTNKISDIDNITEKFRNPKIIFYQKRNKLIKNFINSINILSTEQKRIFDLMDEHIIPEHKYEIYYLINKNIINELNSKLKDEKLSMENKYLEAHDIPKKLNLLEIGEEIINKCNLKFPKNFVLIQEKVFKKFLENCDIDFYTTEKGYKYKYRDDLIIKKYQVKLGERHAFIKIEEGNPFIIDEENNNINEGKVKERIFVCRYNEEEEIFEVEVILSYYKKGQFDEDVKKYISNRGGLEYFYQQEKLDIKKIDIQKNNGIGRKIREVYNVKNLETHMDLTRCKMLGLVTNLNISNNININNINDANNEKKTNKKEMITTSRNPIFNINILQPSKNQSKYYMYNSLNNNANH